MRPAILAAAAAALATALVAAPAGAQKTGTAVPQAASPTAFSAFEMVFEPIVSCRAFDTHATQPLMAARSFLISGPTSLKGQGGAKTGCGIPTSAVAVSISLTTSDASDPGTIAGYPKGLPAQNAVVAYGPSGPDVAGATIGLKGRQLSLAPSIGSVQVAGDVTGYFAPQIYAYVQNDGHLYAETPRVLSSIRTAPGEYTVSVDRNVDYCAAQLTSASSGVQISGATNGLSVDVHSYSLNSSGQVVPTDTSFNLSVHC